MSMAHNIAIELYTKELLKFLDEHKDLPPAETLIKLREKLERNKKSAEGGWL